MQLIVPKCTTFIFAFDIYIHFYKSTKQNWKIINVNVYLLTKVHISVKFVTLDIMYVKYFNQIWFGS